MYRHHNWFKYSDRHMAGDYIDKEALAKKMRIIISKYLPKLTVFETFASVYVEQLTYNIWCQLMSWDDEQLEELVIMDWDLLVSDHDPSLHRKVIEQTLKSRNRAMSRP